MNPVMVPYRSARPLRGLTRTPVFAGLGSSSKKRNWNAFNAAYPGTQVNQQGNYVLPAKFGGVVINQGQLDDLSGTWYGATYHPDGDQAGWQKKFDAVLQSIGAYNAFYGVTKVAPPQIVAPTPVPLIPAPVPTPTPTAAPTPTPTPASTTLPATSSTPAITVNVPASVPPDQTSGLIQQLIAQGASAQQAFTAAMQSLAAQGVQPTPQVQQQVANDVAAAGSPQQASTLYLAAGAAALILFGILMSRRRKH